MTRRISSEQLTSAIKNRLVLGCACLNYNIKDDSNQDKNERRPFLHSKKKKKPFPQPGLSTTIGDANAAQDPRRHRPKTCAALRLRAQPRATAANDVVTIARNPTEPFHRHWHCAQRPGRFARLPNDYYYLLSRADTVLKRPLFFFFFLVTQQLFHISLSILATSAFLF